MKTVVLSAQRGDFGVQLKITSELWEAIFENSQIHLFGYCDLKFDCKEMPFGTDRVDI